MRTILFLFFILMLASCSKNPVEETNEAIDVALSLLSKGECDEALSVLNDAGNPGDNGIYLQVLASAHACKAGFDEIAFINDDLADMDTTSGSTILKSISVASLSDETAPDSADYVSIRTGIDTILNSTSTVGQTARTSKFGVRKSGDMGVQALILSIVNLGKFLNYYGNVDATGVKGGGTGTNNCFINYNDPRAQAVTGATTGACASDSDGHPDLDQATATGKRRICEGLMLVTNTLDILDNIDLSGASSLSKLEEVSAKVNTFKTAAVAAGLGTLINMTSQSQCETYINTPAQLLDMEYLYALVFETGLQ